MTRRQAPRKSAVGKVHKALGDESPSDESDEFQSVSTDYGATNYDLDYTSKSTKGTTNPKKSRQTISPTKSILKSPPPASQQNRRSMRITPVEESPRSPDKSSSRVHFSTNVQYEPKAGTSSKHNSQRNDTNPSEKSSATQASARAGPSANKSSRRKQTKPKKNNPLLREIRNLQQTVGLLIPKLPFSRLFREILRQYADHDMRVTFTALEAMQEAAELYLVQLFEDSYRCTVHRDRATLMVKDIELVRFLRGPQDAGNFH